MNYTMTEPCDACPYLKGSGFTWPSLVRHAVGEFACHKTCKLSDDTGNYEPKAKSLHCAGALIFLEKQGKPHQLMRIAERLGMYDCRKLNMSAPVVSTPRDCRRGMRAVSSHVSEPDNQRLKYPHGSLGEACEFPERDACDIDDERDQGEQFDAPSEREMGRSG